MGEGKSPSASGHPSVIALEGERSGLDEVQGPLPTLKLGSFSACQQQCQHILCVSLSVSHPRK